MKKIIAIILAALMLCSLAACAAAENTDAPGAPDESASQTDAGNIDYNAIYGDLIEKYRTALTEKWDFEKLEENGMSYLLSYLSGDDAAAAQVGYAITDINGDGVSELIVGMANSEGEPVQPMLDMYTVAGGEPVKVLSGGERDAYYLCTDGSIANEGSGSAFLSVRFYYTLEDGALKFKEGVVYDFEVDEENPAFAAYDNTLENYKDTPISNEDSEALVSKYAEMYTSPEYTLFFE